jgi:hypothetical protein
MSFLKVTISNEPLPIDKHSIWFPHFFLINEVKFKKKRLVQISVKVTFQKK